MATSWTAASILATNSVDGKRSFIDPSTLMRIKNLQLRAKVVVDGFFNGLHRSPYHGFSAEFSEYRPYSPGDDLRYLDWKLYARSDRHHIKRFEDETNRRCYLVVDLSQSMDYTSRDYSKSDYARTLAATFAYYLALQRDAVGLQVFDESVTEFIAARYRPGHMHQLMVCLERATGGQGTDLVAPIAQIASLINKRGLVVLISDLLAPIDALHKNLAYLRSRGHEVLILRILDPTEERFELSDATMLRDIETGRETYVQPDQVKSEYQRRFATHRDQLHSMCADLGVDLARLLIDEPLELALFHLLHAQLRRGRRRTRYATIAGAAGRRYV